MTRPPDISKPRKCTTVLFFMHDKRQNDLQMASRSDAYKRGEIFTHENSKQENLLQM